MKRCQKYGAGPLGNCGYHGCETPRASCPHEAKQEAVRRDHPDPIEMNVTGSSAMVDDASPATPAQSKLINNAPLRHLWRLGADDFCPDCWDAQSRNGRLKRDFTTPG